MDTNRKEQGGMAPEKREDQPRPQEKQQAGTQQQQHRKEAPGTKERAQEPPKGVETEPNTTEQQTPRSQDSKPSKGK
ncbi:hypothetical protein [Marinobacterium arenosum]|uniref:hypothetical protein n=1 Tax=Marinobacterium arenosum TaxID=2862496 RepID=UPI001C9473EB|nr:hypothetical protein [Marinobacterium arenosum]MBY4675005.1 hypothetical protein [Marinobacterium arenosum]